MRGPIRAMNAHLRDPLRLGGRPLFLAYIPSPPSTGLWFSDLPPVLANMKDEELLRSLSSLVPVQEVSNFQHMFSVTVRGRAKVVLFASKPLFHLICCFIILCSYSLWPSVRFIFQALDDTINLFEILDPWNVPVCK